MSNEKIVLVTGGTGNQGGATVDHLLAEKRVRVRVLTRSFDSPKAKRLASLGIELVRGDFDDSASLTAALVGVSAAFSVQQFTEKGGVEAEEMRGKRFADAVKAAGSPHLVYSSVEGAERQSGVPHFESKWKIEQYIRELKLPATILRPVSFMDMVPASPLPRAMLLGIFKAKYGLSHRFQLVATHDIGWFAARALEDPQGFAGRIIPIAGDELSVGELLQVYKDFTGHIPMVAPIPSFAAKLMLPKDIELMFRWIRDRGFNADITEMRKEYPQLMTFSTWLKIQQSQPNV